MLLLSVCVGGGGEVYFVYRKKITDISFKVFYGDNGGILTEQFISWPSSDIDILIAFLVLCISGWHLHF